MQQDSAKKAKWSHRLAVAFAKFFRTIAYLSLFLGIMSVLGVAVGATIKYWPISEESSQVIDADILPGSHPYVSSFDAIPPQFRPLLFTAITFLVVGIIVVFWAAAKRRTELLVNWINRKLGWAKWLVELVGVVITWTAAILVARWLWPDLANALSVVGITAMGAGLGSFGMMRLLARRYFD